MTDILSIGDPRSAPAGSSLTRVSYTAGQKPTAPGPYVRFDHPPEEVVALLTAAIPAPLPAEKRHPLRTRLLLVLAATMAGAVVADRMAGFDRWTFTRVLVPTAIAAWIFVLVSTRSRSGARKEQARTIAAQADMMTVCRDIVATIADDVAAGKPVTGWVDLTGAQQPGKLMARGTSSSGARVELFRDEWFCLTAPLRDGTRLRLVAADREKYKHPRSRGRKTKPGSTQTLSTLEVRLRIHPAAYRTRQPEAQTGAVHALQLASMKATPDTVSAVFTRSTGLHLAEVMHGLAHVYRHLERAGPAPPEGAP